MEGQSFKSYVLRLMLTVVLYLRMVSIGLCICAIVLITLHWSIHVVLQPQQQACNQSETSCELELCCGNSKLEGSHGCFQQFSFPTQPQILGFNPKTRMEALGAPPRICKACQDRRSVPKPREEEWFLVRIGCTASSTYHHLIARNAPFVENRKNGPR